MPTGIYKHQPQQGFQKGCKRSPNAHSFKKGVKLTEEHKKNLKVPRIGSGVCKHKSHQLFQKGHPSYVTKETRKKMSKFWTGKTGKENNSWKGGKSRTKSGGKEYQKWRVEVFLRNNFTCQDCKKRGCYLEAHHIKSWANYPELRFDVNNGRTLCLDCHKLTPSYRKKVCKIKL